MNAEDADLFHRINDALSGKETPLTSAFYKAVAVFRWPSPATLGCLLALVREAHGQPAAHVCWTWEFDANHPTHVYDYGRLPRRMWDVDDITDWEKSPATSEAEALVIALEAAP